MSTTAIILAGGTGVRFKGSIPKQFHEIGGKTLLEICLQRFHDHSGIDAIILVCPAEHVARSERIATACSKVVRVLAGGATRQGSSSIGTLAVPAGTGDLLIHDAARALVPPDLIGRVLAGLNTGAAVVPVVPAGDTTVRVDDAGAVLAVLDREKLRRVQTPQGFSLAIIRQAHELAQNEGFCDASDDCSLVLRYELAPVVTVDGDMANIKITYSTDLGIAKTLLKA
jgi:2-C-methyl-D-erythritol 4-phosphate cytidylyltransferase